MATTTARLGLRKPAGSDTVNVVTDIDNAMDTLDAVVGLTDCTSTTRPSTPFKNQLIRESDTGSYYVSNGSAPASASWVPVFSTEGPVTVGYTGPTAPLRIQTTYSTPSGNRMIDGRKAGDANPAIAIDFDGKHQWGPGGASPSDTNLYRGAAGVLQTDSQLVVAGSLVANGHGLATTFEGLATSDLTIPATTPADVPGATVTFTTVRANAVAIITCNFDWRLTALGTGYCYGTLVVDGTAQREALFVAQSVETRLPGNFSKRITLATAGSHTIKLQGRKDANVGTAIFAGGTITGVEVTLYD